MIKLKDVKNNDYEEVTSLMNRELKEIPSKNLELDLENFFYEYSGVMNIYINATADSIVDKDINYYEFCFGIECNTEKK